MAKTTPARIQNLIRCFNLDLLPLALPAVICLYIPVPQIYVLLLYVYLASLLWLDRSAVLPRFKLRRVLDFFALAASMIPFAFAFMVLLVQERLIMTKNFGILIGINATFCIGLALMVTVTRAFFPRPFAWIGRHPRLRRTTLVLLALPALFFPLATGLSSSYLLITTVAATALILLAYGGIWLLRRRGTALGYPSLLTTIITVGAILFAVIALLKGSNSYQYPCVECGMG